MAPPPDLAVSWAPPAVSAVLQKLPPELRTAVEAGLQGVEPLVALSVAQANAAEADALQAGESAKAVTGQAEAIVAGARDADAREAERWSLLLRPLAEALAAGKELTADGLSDAFGLPDFAATGVAFEQFMGDRDIELRLGPHIEGMEEITERRLSAVAHPAETPPLDVASTQRLLSRTVAADSLDVSPLLGVPSVVKGGEHDGWQVLALGAGRFAHGFRDQVEMIDVDLLGGTCLKLSASRLESGKPPLLHPSASAALALVLVARDAPLPCEGRVLGSYLALGAGVPTSKGAPEVGLARAAKKIISARSAPRGPGMAAALLELSYRVSRVSVTAGDAIEPGDGAGGPLVIDLGRVRWCRASAQAIVWLPLVSNHADTVGGPDRPWVRGIPAPGAAWFTESPAISTDPDWYARVVLVEGSGSLWALGPDGTWWDLDLDFEALLDARQGHRRDWQRALERVEEQIPAQIESLKAAAETLAQEVARVGTSGSASDEHSSEFSAQWINDTAGRYEYADDAAPRNAGLSARRRGYYTRAEFLAVVRWKAARAVPRAEANSEHEVERATRSAFDATTEHERIVSLVQLEGVGVPVASALLAFAFPESYPILDFRALETLGRRTNRTQYSPEYWVDYLEECRGIAKAANVSIRLLDKALWQASRERSRPDKGGG